MRGLRRLFLACLLTLVGAGLCGAAEHGGEHADLGHGNATASLESPAAFQTDLAIYTFTVFMLLLAILSKAAWPKISEALIEREKRIENDLASATAKHDEAKRLLAENEAKLAGAAAEVRAMLDEARRDAEAVKDSIVADARKGADQERQRAVREIELAADSAMRGLAEKSAGLAAELAGKAIRETITPAKQAELVKAALASLGAGASKN
jgi:F-type H+-transporting ATPase subunit b